MKKNTKKRTIKHVIIPFSDCADSETKTSEVSYDELSYDDKRIKEAIDGILEVLDTLPTTGAVADALINTIFYLHIYFEEKGIPPTIGEKPVSMFEYIFKYGTLALEDYNKKNRNLNKN